MNAAAYNEKLLFISAKGDLSRHGFLYREYCVAFDEWYGEAISEDSLSESGYPENDFREWLQSRLMDSFDELAEREPEISEDHLKEEIDRIHEKRT